MDNYDKNISDGLVLICSFLHLILSSNRSVFESLLIIITFWIATELSVSSPEFFPHIDFDLDYHLLLQNPTNLVHRQLNCDLRNLYFFPVSLMFNVNPPLRSWKITAKPRNASLIFSTLPPAAVSSSHFFQTKELQVQERGEIWPGGAKMEINLGAKKQKAN